MSDDLGKEFLKAEMEKFKDFTFKVDTPFKMLETITARRDSKTRANIKIKNLEEGQVYTAEVLKYCGWNIKDLYIKKKIITKANLAEDFAPIILKDIIKEEVEEEENNIGEAIGEFTDKLAMARRFINIQPIFYDKKNIWWLWNINKCKWEMVDQVDLFNKLDVYLKNSVSVQTKIKQEIIEALKRVGRKNVPKPAKKTWIQFKDTIIDIETDEELKATPAYFVTNPIPTEVGESEDTPTIDKIFEEWVGKEYVQTLHEIIAYCLLADYPIHRIFCFVGAGLNGKGCFMRLLKKFIGKDNTTSTDLDLLLVSRFEITKLYKKLVCLMGETNFNEMKKTALLKRLTGQDLIGFEIKNKNPFDDENYAKIIIATNSLPTTTDKTKGFYRRWFIINFDKTFSEKKDVLKDIPKIEYHNLAKKSIRILKELMEKREFANEGSIEDRQKKYEATSNPLMRFIKEKCIDDPNGEIPYFKFYEAFENYLIERKLRIISKKEVTKQLKNESFETKPLNVKKDDGNYTTWIHILGLRFKGKIEDFDENKWHKCDNSVFPLNPLYRESSEIQHLSHLSHLSWDERALVHQPCMYPEGKDQACCEMPCNRINGEVYCKEHFEKIQKENEN